MTRTYAIVTLLLFFQSAASFAGEVRTFCRCHCINAWSPNRHYFFDRQCTDPNWDIPSLTDPNACTLMSGRACPGPGYEKFAGDCTPAEDRTQLVYEVGCQIISERK